MTSSVVEEKRRQEESGTEVRNSLRKQIVKVVLTTTLVIVALFSLVRLVVFSETSSHNVVYGVFGFLLALFIARALPESLKEHGWVKPRALVLVIGAVSLLTGIWASFGDGIMSRMRYTERCVNSSCSWDAGYVPEARGSIEKIKGGESKKFNVIGSFEILNNSVGYYLELSPANKEWCWIGSSYGSVWHTRDGVLATRTSSLDGYRTELVLKGVKSLQVSVISQKADAVPVTGKDECSKQKHPWAF